MNEKHMRKSKGLLAFERGGSDHGIRRRGTYRNQGGKQGGNRGFTVSNMQNKEEKRYSKDGGGEEYSFPYLPEGVSIPRWGKVKGGWQNWKKGYDVEIGKDSDRWVSVNYTKII